MKLYQWICICALTSCFVGSHLLAQTVISKPKDYVTPLEGIDVTEERSGTGIKGKLWFVYGDRNGATGTSNPGSGKKLSPLQFGEEYCVVEENGAYLHIYKDPKVNYRGVLSGEKQDLGWVHKNDLLLWEHSLLSAETGNLPRKAMVLNTLESLSSENFSQLESGKVRFYHNPERTIESGLSSGLFQIFFVYKIDEENGAVLLGKDHFFSRGGQSMLLGWVPRSRVVMWNQRVALEPNWNKEAANERKAYGQPARFFLDEDNARNYKEGLDFTPASQIWSGDTYDKRHIGEYRRFPILQGELRDGMAMVGVMGDINAAHATMTAEMMAEVQDQFTSSKAQARNVDIIFVVDATKSMDPYYAPVIKGLKNSVQDIANNPGDPNSYRFGALVYRDTPEKQITESKRLTSQSSAVSNFLESILDDYEVENAEDRDTPEAVYYGLYSALRELGMDKNHTNVVVLVGDAGNHYRKDKTYVKQDDLINLLGSYSCNMLVFQAQNRANSSFEEFISQSKYLVRKVAEDKYNQSKKTAELADIQLQFPVWRKDQNDQNIWRLENGALAGAVMASPPNRALSPDRLQAEIQRLLDDIRGDHNSKMDALENVVMGGEGLEDALQQAPPQSQSPYVSSYSAAMIYFLHKQGFSDEQLKIVANQNYQMFMPGYAAIHLKDHKHPLFKPVLFLTRAELADVIRDLEKLNLSTSASALREEFVNAWYGLIRAHIGDIKRKDMQEWSLERVSEVVFGIPTTSELAGTPLKNILDPEKVDDYKLNSYVESINTRTRELNKIFNANNYPYSFLSNDHSYYWVEQDLLP